MKIFLKRRNFLFLFIVFIIVAIICMTYNLNQIVTEDLSNGNVKVTFFENIINYYYDCAGNVTGFLVAETGVKNVKFQ